MAKATAKKEVKPATKETKKAAVSPKANCLRNAHHNLFMVILQLHSPLSKLKVRFFYCCAQQHP